MGADPQAKGRREYAGLQREFAQGNEAQRNQSAALLPEFKPPHGWFFIAGVRGAG